MSTAAAGGKVPGQAATNDHGASVNDWLNVVRRLRLGPTVKNLDGATVKNLAYYLAGRANADGTHLYPGVARSAVECELSPATVRRALAVLRGHGLVELVKRGNRRTGQADEYRLTLHPDLLERLHVPTPDEHSSTIRTAADRGQNRDRQRALRERRKANNAHQVSVTDDSITLTQVSAETPDPITLTQESVTPSNNAQTGNGITLTQVSAHPSLETPCRFETPPDLVARSSLPVRPERATSAGARASGVSREGWALTGQEAATHPPRPTTRRRGLRTGVTCWHGGPLGSDEIGAPLCEECEASERACGLGVCDDCGRWHLLGTRCEETFIRTAAT